MKKYITVNNYKEFKPSEFVESFISDIEVAERIGKPMDMSVWVGNGCLPCLGGMACMNMGISPYRKESNLGDKVSLLGDMIRAGEAEFTRIAIEDIYNIHLPENIFNIKETFINEVRTKREFKKLKKQVAYYADTLKKAGY